MTTTVKFLWLILLVSLICGAVALSTWGIPAPTAEVVKDLPVEQFLKK